MNKSDHHVKTQKTQFLSHDRWIMLATESVLIVVSILVAFFINAWWENHKIEEQRIQLLQTLLSDFEATSKSLDQAIEQEQAVVSRSRTYRQVVRDGIAIPEDSLFYCFAAIGEGAFFQPTIASYKSAVATGTIELVRSQPLINTLTDFDLALDLYQLHLNIAGNLFYQGPVHQFRLAVGSMYGPGEPPGTPLRDLVPDNFNLRGRLAVATMESMYFLQINILENLTQMQESVVKIIKEVDESLVKS